MNPPESVSETKFPSSRQLKWIVTTLMIYFGLRLVYFAATISPYVPPDEVTHFGICQVFSGVFLLPPNSPASFQYGLVTNVPWLYYWVMGKLLSLNFFGVPDLVFLRLANIPLAFATVYYVWRLLRLLTEDRLAGVVLVAALTNTLMFSFQSAAVSYDNLTNLLAAMATYYLFAFFKERSLPRLALALLCLLAGCLTKVTYLPLALLLALVFALREARRVPELLRAGRQALKSCDWRGGALLAAILVALLLNLNLYGRNYLRYGTVAPSVENVLPFEQAMKHRLTARNRIFAMYKEGRITVEKAKEMASQISHKGDRQDTINLVQNYAGLEQAGFRPMVVAPYSAMWILQMLSTSFGIKAHIGMPNQGFSFIPLTVLILFVLASYPVRWRPRDLGGFPSCLLAIPACYAAFLVYKINYPAYVDSKDIVLTVAGRYLFPVLGPLYAVSSLYLMRLFKGYRARLALAAFAVLVLVGSDFPFFLSSVTPEWFDWTPK